MGAQGCSTSRVAAAEGGRQSIATGDAAPFFTASARLRCSTDGSRGPNTAVMRIVLEWLGLVRPDPARRQPVAVPAWAPYAVAASVAMVATVVAVTLRLLIGAVG